MIHYVRLLQQRLAGNTKALFGGANVGSNISLSGTLLSCGSTLTASSCTKLSLASLHRFKLLAQLLGLSSQLLGYWISFNDRAGEGEELGYAHAAI
jgi:hypothetical protein